MADDLDIEVSIKIKDSEDPCYKYVISDIDTRDEDEDLVHLKADDLFTARNTLPTRIVAFPKGHGFQIGNRVTIFIRQPNS